MSKLSPKPLEPSLTREVIYLNVANNFVIDFEALFDYTLGMTDEEEFVVLKGLCMKHPHISRACEEALAHQTIDANNPAVDLSDPNEIAGSVI